MTRAPFTIAVVAFVCSTAAAAQQEVTCDQPGYAAWEIHPVMKLDVQK